MNRIALVGHCSPDSSYLTLAARKALPGVEVIRVNDDQQLTAFLSNGGGLMLINRVLDGEFTDNGGVQLLLRIRQAHPGLRAMLISNYPEAQTEAQAAGAAPGFGKRDVSSPKAVELIRAAAQEPAQVR